LPAASASPLVIQLLDNTEDEGVRRTRVFLMKSAQLLENRRVNFFQSAKNVERVRKDMKRKNLPPQLGLEGSRRLAQERDCGPLPPIILDEYQKTGLTEIAIRK
jgi:hypothetical protein